MLALFAILAVMSSCGSEKSTGEVESTETEVVVPSEGEVSPSSGNETPSEVSPSEGEVIEKVDEPAVK